MKLSFTKILSATLASAVTAAFIFSSAVTVSADTADIADTVKKELISIDVDSHTFRDFNKIYCYIYDESADSQVIKWESKKGLMENIEGSNVWSIDLAEKGIELDSTHTYNVMFSSDQPSQTENLTIDGYDSEKEYTAVFSDEYTQKSFHHYCPEFKYKWKGDNEGEEGVDVIKINADKRTFKKDCDILYCTVVDETDNDYALEFGALKNEASGIWSFDFGKHGIELVRGHKYTVQFTDGGGETVPLTIEAYDNANDYTAVFTGRLKEDEVIGMNRYLYRWTYESPENDLLCGDVNGDGSVNISDATAIQMYVAKAVTLDNDSLYAADTNGDGMVDITDATVIQKYIAKIIEKL